VSVTRPAQWVKIENTAEGRPQAELDAADIVYEQVTEAGITHFITLVISRLTDETRVDDLAHDARPTFKKIGRFRSLPCGCVVSSKSFPLSLTAVARTV
jgi:hypothetical protein